MVRRQMAFKNLHVFVLRNLMKYLTEMLPDRAVYCLLTPFRGEHPNGTCNPSGCAQTPVLS